MDFENITLSEIIQKRTNRNNTHKKTPNNYNFTYMCNIKQKLASELTKQAKLNLQIAVLRSAGGAVPGEWPQVMAWTPTWSPAEQVDLTPTHFFGPDPIHATCSPDLG